MGTLRLVVNSSLFWLISKEDLDTKRQAFGRRVIFADVAQLIGGLAYIHTGTIPGRGPAPSESVYRIIEIIDVWDQRMPEYEFVLLGHKREDPIYNGTFGLVLAPIQGISAREWPKPWPVHMDRTTHNSIFDASSS
jgi:hypothetical protein